MIDRIKKYAAVIFLTILIWTYAYLAQEEKISRMATLAVGGGVRSDLQVIFDRPTPIPLNLTLQGPASKVAVLKRRLLAADTDQDKERLDFLYDPETQNQSLPGTYTLTIIDLLQADEKLRDMGLRVIDCDVKTVKVTVDQLVEKRLTIQCVDPSGKILQPETLEPATMAMFVRKEYEGPAMITMTSQQVELARKSVLHLRPYVTLGSQQVYAKNSVSVKLPATEVLLQSRPLQPRVGLLVSRNLLGKYQVELVNEDELTSVTTILATPEAFSEFEKNLYQVLVEVRDDDVTLASTEGVKRPVVYNFPPASVRLGEIQLDPTVPVRQAHFRLIPLAAPAASKNPLVNPTP
ncbi:MAG: hypothetical protein GX455_00465 [Phycisphaerae bacterium]|nr:hypothetical protein [Phycisphaerae bacterium]